MSMDRATLESHLDALGWSYVEHLPGTHRVSHATDEGEVSVYLRLSEHWLVASVVPFLETGGTKGFELSRWLLRMNRDMFQAKFAYDEDGDVVLTVELPTESLDFSEVKLALDNLLGEAIRHRATLRGASG